MIPALLKWIGNKQRFASVIIAHMPERFNNYYEPFLGSGAVMAQLLESNQSQGTPELNGAFGSDVLPFLVDIFNLIKTDPQALIDHYACEIEKYYANPNETYLKIRDRFNQDRNALDFCVLSRTCYSGVIRFRQADGYMSTPRGPHKPIAPEAFADRVHLWSMLMSKATFRTEGFEAALDRAQEGDVVYCDPPYTHSQTIIYGAQGFDINRLWTKIYECKERGAKVMLSINGSRKSQQKDISVKAPEGLFARELEIDCGISKVERLRRAGQKMHNEVVHDKLCLTW